MSFIRDNKDIVKGDQLWLFIGTRETENGTTTLKPVAFATQHSLNRSLNTTSVSSKDHGNTSYIIPGEGSWTCSTESLMSMEGTGGAIAFKEIMNAFDKGLLVDITFGKIKNYVAAGIVDVDGAQNWQMSSPCWEGKGYITSLQASGGHGDSATFSCEITGVGPLTKTTAPFAITVEADPDMSPADQLLLLSNISTDPTTTTDVGTSVKVEPSGYRYTSYFVDVTTVPETVVSDAGSYWTFPMPNSDVTVMTSFKETYAINKSGEEELYTVTDKLGTQFSYAPANVEVNLVPNDPTTINSNSYTGYYTTVAGGTRTNGTWVEGTTYAYWTFQMPSEAINAYVSAI